MKNNLGGQLDQRNGHRRWILACHEDAGALVPHLAHDAYQAGHEVLIVDVLVGLVEDDQLVEGFPFQRVLRVSV
jgi:hypothetical protein